jgi:hypothetical protein
MHQVLPLFRSVRITGTERTEPGCISVIQLPHGGTVPLGTKLREVLLTYFKAFFQFLFTLLTQDFAKYGQKIMSFLEINVF